MLIFNNDKRSNMILLKNADLYTPKHEGIQDIIINNGKIVYIGKYKENENFDEIIDCKGKIVCPEFIDGHEHIIYTEYYDPIDIINSGVGTVVGVLANESGQNFVEKNIKTAKRLRKLGIDTYCLAGSKVYRENIEKTILEDKIVIGVKTALNSQTLIKPNNPTYEEMKELAITTYNLSKKLKRKLQLHIHIETERGDLNTSNLSWIDRIVEETDVPYSIFKLTHAQKYKDKILEYAIKGCYLDFTAFHEKYDQRYDYLVKAILDTSIDTSKISISSDLGVLNMEKGWRKKESPFTLLHTIKVLMKEKQLKFEDVLPLITTNPGILISKNAGKIKQKCRCKILIFDKEFNIEKVINERTDNMLNSRVKQKLDLI